MCACSLKVLIFFIQVTVFTGIASLLFKFLHFLMFLDFFKSAFVFVHVTISDFFIVGLNFDSVYYSRQTICLRLFKVNLIIYWEVKIDASLSNAFVLFPQSFAKLWHTFIPTCKLVQAFREVFGCYNLFFLRHSIKPNGSFGHYFWIGFLNWPAYHLP